MATHFSALAAAVLIGTLATSSLSMAATPEQNMDAMRAAAKRYTKVKIAPVIKDYCNTPEWCEGFFGKVQVRSYGRGVAMALSSSLVSPKEYRRVCTAIFQGLSGSHIELAEETIEMAFVAAAATGEFKKDVTNVQVEIRPGMSSGPLQCNFFKY